MEEAMKKKINAAVRSLLEEFLEGQMLAWEHMAIAISQVAAPDPDALAGAIEGQLIAFEDMRIDSAARKTAVRLLHAAMTAVRTGASPDRSRA